MNEENNNDSTSPLDAIKALQGKGCLRRIRAIPFIYHAVKTGRPLDGNTLKQAIDYQFLYSIWGLIVGTTCIVLGCILFFLGITGSISWIAKLPNLTTELTNASPGAVLFVVGFLIVYITKYDIDVSPTENDSDKKDKI